MLAGVPPAGGRHLKKLEEVARTWARGDLTTEQEHERQEAQLDDQFAFWGIAQEDGDRERVPELYLWPENVDAWSLFLRCQTQWLTRGMEGRAYALNYPGCEIVMRHCVPRKLRAKRFEQLQVMEQAALRGWGERAKREG